jgi:TatD DNase family protein
MLLTDTHTHLYYEMDDAKRTALMQRCFENHVDMFFLPNDDADSVKQVFELVAAYPNN